MEVNDGSVGESTAEVRSKTGGGTSKLEIHVGGPTAGWLMSHQIPVCNDGIIHWVSSTEKPMLMKILHISLGHLFIEI